MPDLQELCVSPDVPMSVELMKVDLSVTSCVGADSALSREQLDMILFEQSVVALSPIPPPPTHKRDVLFAKDLCYFLNITEVAIPGCGRSITCLLKGMTTKDNGKGKKVGVSS
jgi:hypothetical protein